MSSDIKSEDVQYRTGERSDLGDMVRLMTQSAFHCAWSLEDLTRLVIAPLELKPVVVFTERDETVGWASIAWLSSQAQSGFMRKTRKLQPTDWNSGPWLWVIDVVASLGTEPLSHWRFAGTGNHPRDWGDPKRCAFMRTTSSLDVSVAQRIGRRFTRKTLLQRKRR